MRAAFFLQSALALAIWSSDAMAADGSYPGASVVPKSRAGWEKWTFPNPEPGAPADEAARWRDARRDAGRALRHRLLPNRSAQPVQPRRYAANRTERRAAADQLPEQGR